MSFLDKQHTALLLLDCEEGVASRIFSDTSQREAYAKMVLRLIDAAKTAGVPVIRVDIEFRAGHLDVSASNAYFTAAKAANRLLVNSEQVAPMHELTMAVTDTPRVVKRRIGGIVGTDLEVLLRGLGRTQLLLAGLITRGAVLSTACHAADLDYQVAVVSDACGEMDPEVHRVLLTAVLPLRATVLSVSEVVAAFADA